jgi:putative SOS response-associated peptidase YedK
VSLDPQLNDAGALPTVLLSYPTDEMQAEQVSDIVNSVRNEVAPRLAR